MEQVWRNPEKPVEDLDFFTRLYESAQWLIDQHPYNRSYTYADRNKEPEKFYDRSEDIRLTPAELEKVGEFMTQRRIPGALPESVQIKVQGRNPQVYEKSPGGAVEVTMRTGDEFTVFAFVNGYERDEHPSLTKAERALTIIKAYWKVTDWHFPQQSGIMNPRNWHDERFKLSQMHKDEGLNILELINFLN